MHNPRFVASLGHLAVGIAAARLIPHGGSARSRIGWSIGLCALAMAPDLDVAGMFLGVPYRAEWGHRGASHSLVFTAALGLSCGLVVSALLRRRRPEAFRICLVTIAVAMSHGALDSLTDGGLGPALFWPFENGRHFAPLRPIPVAPIAHRFVSLRGLRVVAAEGLIFLPLVVFALWPRRLSQRDPVGDHDRA